MVKTETTVGDMFLQRC